MADAPGALVELLRVQRGVPLHALAEIRFTCADEQRNVVRHQAVSKAVPAALDDDLAQPDEVDPAIEFGDEDRPLVDAARPDVVDGAGFFVARLAWHVSKRSPAKKLTPGGSDPVRRRGRGSDPLCCLR